MFLSDEWIKRQILKWLGLDKQLDLLNGGQFEQHMRLKELDRRISELEQLLKPKRDERGRFEGK